MIVQTLNHLIGNLESMDALKLIMQKIGDHHIEKNVELEDF